jgi:hypothetical protein
MLGKKFSDTTDDHPHYLHILYGHAWESRLQSSSCVRILNSVEWADSKAHVCGLWTRWNGVFYHLFSFFWVPLPTLDLSRKGRDKYFSSTLTGHNGQVYFGCTRYTLGGHMTLMYTHHMTIV